MPMVSSRVLAMCAVLATAALWGVSTPLVKDLVGTVPPCTLAVMRLAIALAVLLPVLILQGRRPRIGWTSVLMGLTGVAASQLLQNIGMASMPAGPAAVVLLAGTVVFTTLLGWTILGERCSLPVGLAMMGCGIGVALVAVANGGAALAFPMQGLLLVLAAAGAWALYAVIGRRDNDEDSTEVTTGALAVGLVSLLPFMVLERPTVATVSMGLHDLVSLLVLGVLVTAGSYLCFGYGIQRLRANEASILCSVEPAFGLVFAWLLLREGISVEEAIGAAVIVASCVLVAFGSEKSVIEAVGEPVAPAALAL